MEMTIHSFSKQQGFPKQFTLVQETYFMQNTELETIISAAIYYPAGDGQVAQTQRWWLLA